MAEEQQPEAIDEQKSLALLSAAHGGDLEIFKLLYNMPGVNRQVRDKYDKTLLHVATQGGYVDVATFLLEQPETDVNEIGCGKLGHTALLTSALFGHLDMLKVLWNHESTRKDFRDANGLNVLMYASISGATEIVVFLLSQPEVDINAVSDHAETALHFAAQEGRVETFKKLFSHPGVNRMVCNKSGANIMMKAARSGSSELVNFLLTQPDVSFDLNFADDLGNTALLYAADKNALDTLTTLFNHPDVNTNVRNKEGHNVLMVAVSQEYANMDVIRFLLRQPNMTAELNDTDVNGRSILHHAALRGENLEIFLEIYNQPHIRKDQTDILGSNLLMIAACGEAEKIVNFLLEQPETDATATNNTGQTVIHYAAMGGSVPVFKLLSDHPEVDNDATDNEGLNALAMAARAGQQNIVKFLLGLSDGSETTEPTPKAQTTHEILEQMREKHKRQKSGSGATGAGASVSPRHAVLSPALGDLMPTLSSTEMLHTLMQILMPEEEQPAASSDAASLNVIGSAAGQSGDAEAKGRAHAHSTAAVAPGAEEGKQKEGRGRDGAFSITPQHTTRRRSSITDNPSMNTTQKPSKGKAPTKGQSSRQFVKRSNTLSRPSKSRADPQSIGKSDHHFPAPAEAEEITQKPKKPSRADDPEDAAPAKRRRVSPRVASASPLPSPGVSTRRKKAAATPVRKEPGPQGRAACKGVSTSASTTHSAPAAKPRVTRAATAAAAAARDAGETASTATQAPPVMQRVNNDGGEIDYSEIQIGRRTKAPPPPPTASNLT